MKKIKLRKVTLALCLACLLVGIGITAAPDKHGEKAEDTGKTPWVVDIEKLTLENNDFRQARWTGTYLQLTVMSIPPGGEIGLEMHPDIDQFIRIEQGRGRVLMGKNKEELNYVQEVEDDWAVFIPAGYWHNVLNTGEKDLKVYSIYGPPEHPAGTRHKTFADSEADHHHH